MVRGASESIEVSETLTTASGRRRGGGAAYVSTSKSCHSEEVEEAEEASATVAFEIADASAVVEEASATVEFEVDA